jgi:endonuclease/exonuclease/phosphatase family metal-dependent hydrolase
LPIVGVTAAGLGVRIDVDGAPLHAFNVHLPPAPYQPYQLLGIDYRDGPPLATAEEARTAARAARGLAADMLAADIATAGIGPVVVTGDFNEPSHLDWTPRAANAGIHPIAVAWPTSQQLAALGFVDCWRTAHPDETARTGCTWTTEPAAREKHDRIDFVYARGCGLKLRSTRILGERRPEADRVVAPWPSDHRAVLAHVDFDVGSAALA